MRKVHETFEVISISFLWLHWPSLWRSWIHILHRLFTIVWRLCLRVYDLWFILWKCKVKIWNLRNISWNSKWSDRNLWFANFINAVVKSQVLLIEVLNIQRKGKKEASQESSLILNQNKSLWILSLDISIWRKKLSSMTNTFARLFCSSPPSNHTFPCLLDYLPLAQGTVL